MAEEKKRYLDTTGLQELVKKTKEAVTSGTWTGILLDKDENTPYPNYIIKSGSSAIRKSGPSYGNVIIGSDWDYGGNGNLIVGLTGSIGGEDTSEEISFCFNIVNGWEHYLYLSREAKMWGCSYTGYLSYSVVKGDFFGLSVSGRDIFIKSEEDSRAEGMVIDGSMQKVVIPANSSVNGVHISGTGAYWEPNITYAFGVGYLTSNEKEYDEEDPTSVYSLENTKNAIMVCNNNVYDDKTGTWYTNKGTGNVYVLGIGGYTGQGVGKAASLQEVITLLCEAIGLSFSSKS